MSDYQDFFAHHIARHMEAIGESASQVSSQLETGAERIVNALLMEGQVLACGAGSSNALAQFFCTSLLNRYETERPALPALNIGADATTLAAISRDNRFHETFSRQIRAFGREGDVLLLLSEDGQKSNLIQAIQAAHDRQMTVIAITAGEDRDIHSLLHPEDVEIVLPDLSASTFAEVTLVLLNALCSLTEQMLFGS